MSSQYRRGRLPRLLGLADYYISDSTRQRGAAGRENVQGGLPEGCLPVGAIHSLFPKFGEEGYFFASLTWG